MKILYVGYDRGLEIEKDHEVLYVDVNDCVKDYMSVKKKIWNFKPDIAIEREYNDGRAEYGQLFDFLAKALPKCKRVFYAIDTHVSHDRHVLYSRHFQYVFLAISRYVEEFKKLMNGKAYWLPLFFPYRSDTIHPNYNEISVPISFVGRWNKRWFPQRTEYVEALQKHYGSRFFAVTDYANMFTIIKRSKVSFNCSIGKELNFRTFEVLASGTELVTDDVEDIHKIKGLDKRMSLYTSYPQAINYIDGILQNKKEYVHNTLDNQLFIKKNHCFYHRLSNLIRMVRDGVQLEF